jgi:hypothetical protein
MKYDVYDISVFSTAMTHQSYTNKDYRDLKNLKTILMGINFVGGEDLFPISNEQKNMAVPLGEFSYERLELVGVGYRARMEGDLLVMTVGWNHPIEIKPYEGIQIEVPEETKIVVKGIDKQKVGEMAAKIREKRKPEPYKGKGIRYEGEYVRKKSSKSSVA